MQLNPIDMKQIKVDDPFWNDRIGNAVEHVIPYQWRVLNDNEPGAELSHAIKNFKIAAGMEEGTFHGFQFQDSDVAKWIEAASFSLIYKDDPEIRAHIEEALDIIEKAQEESGYMDTHFMLLKPDKKWKEIAHGHELYCAGHFLEAAVAYYQVTGSERLLAIMEKNVALITSIFGNEEGKLYSYPGHEEIELALVKAYHATGKETFLHLAKYFIDARGVAPGFWHEESYTKNADKNRFVRQDYFQAHLPVREQETAEGHAVRAMYLYTAMADVALETKDQSLVDALHILWENVTKRRMYITAGIGSQGDGERFTIDYDLPNDTCYTETCAAIGMAMWSLRMLRMEPKAEYADIMERALYNNVLSGISQDGERYFYVNPLAVKPDVAHYRADQTDVEPSRVKWFGCACCPPNVIRTLCGLGGYLYTQQKNRIYQHLYIGNDASFTVDGETISLHCTSNMPWSGEATIQVSGSANVALCLRIPGYAEGFTLQKNGGEISYDVEDGYVILSDIQDGDMLTISFDMTATFMIANPKVTEDCGKAAVMRGPLVYCAEEADNGVLLNDFVVDLNAPITATKKDIFGGILSLQVSGTRANQHDWQSEALYRPYTPSRRVHANMELIPYCQWNNRGEGEMLVWMNSKG